MSVLLDTCVVSELARPLPNVEVVKYVDGIDPANVFLSAITIGELTLGVALLPDGRRKSTLGSWVAGLEHRFRTQILPVDHRVARLWGELTARAQQQGVVVPAADGLIAATAVHHGLHVATRNARARHFTATGALVHDPWEAS